MLRAYEHVFYRVYCWQPRRGRGTSDFVSAFNAFVFCVIVICWNILFVLTVIEFCIGRASPLLPRLSKVQIIVVLTLLAVPQYFLLVYNQRYRRIAQRFESEPAAQRRKGTVLVALYVVLSFVLLVTGSILRGKL